MAAEWKIYHIYCTSIQTKMANLALVQKRLGFHNHGGALVEFFVQLEK